MAQEVNPKPVTIPTVLPPTPLRRRIGWLMLIILPFLVLIMGYWTAATQAEYDRVNRRMLLYYDILRHAREAIIVTDHNGIVEDWNDGAEHMFGVSAKAAVGNPVTFIIPEEAKAVHAKASQDPVAISRLLSGEVRVIRCWALGKNGPIKIAMRMQAVNDNGVHFFVQINYDKDVNTQWLISQRKPKEQKPRDPRNETR